MQILNPQYSTPLKFSCKSMEVRLWAVLIWHGMIQWWTDRDLKSIFWILTPCRVVDWQWHLGRMCCHQFQTEKIVSRWKLKWYKKEVGQLHRYVAVLHNLPKNNLSSWFMSPSCSLISITSHISQYIHLDFLARILALFRILWPKSRLCSATAKISGSCSQLWWWCSLNLILIPKPVSPTCNFLYL